MDLRPRRRSSRTVVVSGIREEVSVVQSEKSLGSQSSGRYRNPAVETATGLGLGTLEQAMDCFSFLVERESR
jgi:hypothetical protein